MLRKYILAAFSLIGIMMLTGLLRDSLTLANFAMIYILVVLMIAIRLGTIPAMTAALISFLSINFFLTKPYYTFLVADRRDVIELAVFIVVAILAGQLGARARYQTEVAQQRAYEQEILYRLTGSMNQAADAETVHNALTQAMRDDLSARQAYILPYRSEPHRADETVHYLLLQAGSRIYGTICLAFHTALTTQQSRLVQACAAQAAMALERIELTERVRASQQYEEADRLKTAILRAVSHDLRTPITIIKTSASNLQTLGERLQPTERQEIAETIETEADHLNKLIGNLLDLSRLQAGALTLNSELNSLEEVVGDVSARMWETSGRERIQTHFPENMPLVLFDYGLMLQVLSNLVDNALRYEPPESQVEIRGCVENSQILLKVVNHGMTIAPNEKELIMQPFYHGKDGHIGLGLAIAKGIVETHHGALWLEDTPGGGATFIVTLPLENQEIVENETQDTGR
jgi:two-component system, OmpR family, sensor histidine kinase KdpD